MAGEADLRPGDSNQATTMATAAMMNSARGQPRWVRILVGIFAGIVAVVGALKLVETMSNFGSLPKYDAQSTKNTLSDLNKSNNLNASSYNFIKATSSSAEEVRCTAGLALRDRTNVEYDYRIFKEASGDHRLA